MVIIEQGQPLFKAVASLIMIVERGLLLSELALVVLEPDQLLLETGELHLPLLSHRSQRQYRQASRPSCCYCSCCCCSFNCSFS